MADAKDVHAKDQMSGAIMEMATQVVCFNRELRHQGLTRVEALSLSRVYLRTWMTNILSKAEITGPDTK